MQYKTICLRMIQDRPEMYDRLLSNRTLVPTLERFARELESSHLAGRNACWRNRAAATARSRARPWSWPSGNWVCLPPRLRRRKTSRSPWRTQWRSSVVLRRPLGPVAAGVRDRCSTGFLTAMSRRRRPAPLRPPIPFSLLPRPGP